VPLSPYYVTKKTRVVAIFLVAIGCYATGNPASALQRDNDGRAHAARSLPRVFGSVLAEVKAKTSIPVLLPTELPRPVDNAKHAVVEKTTTDEYGVALYYELEAGDAGFAAFFGARNESPYSPRELGNVREVKLTRGIVGFFRPVSCGGSCAPANLWWEHGGPLYQIQLKLASTLSAKKQQRVITAVANSAILAGPR
jgi:hypothetical protein